MFGPFFTRGVLKTLPWVTVPKQKISLSSVLSSKDYYKILAISQNASPSDVKKAYYQLAKKHHPDRNPNDPKAASLFQDISEAYEVLSDESKRNQYDSLFSNTTTSHGFSEFGSKSKKNTSFKARQAWRYTAESDPLELFRTVFGEFAANLNQAPGDHTSFAQSSLPIGFVSISLEEAAVGVPRSVKFTGHFDQEVLVEIPAGVEDGQTVRLKISNQHEALVQIKVEERSNFRREGCHLHSDLTIDIWDAVLGSIVDVQGLSKTLKVQLPKNLSSHTTLVLPGQGFKQSNLSGGFGHHYLHVKINSINLKDI